MPTFGSLFSGIGGLDLGLERAGWDCRWQVENDPWCSQVLAKHWPDVPRYADVHDVGAELEPVDLICGGFPCQPVSNAGRRRAQDDPRWLWPEFARLLRLLRPRLVLVENVTGLLARGMGDVLGELAASGYDAEWDCIPAAAVGAPHLRYRVFVVAHAHGLGQGREATVGPPGITGARSEGTGAEPDGSGDGAIPHADGERREGERSSGLLDGVRPALGNDADRRRGALPDPDSGGRDGWPGIFGEGRRPEPTDSGWWLTEPDVGRVAHGVPARVDRLRALGNAVVPQVAEWIGRRLMEVA